jgi:hypothetical protein
MDAKTQSPPPDTTSGFRAPHESSSRQPEAPTDAMKDALRQAGELKSYAAYFVAAKVDAIKATVRNVGLYAALGVIGLMAGGAIIVTAAVLLCLGLSQLLASAFDPPKPWFGNLIVGAVLLALVLAGAWLAVSSITKSSRKRTVKKYEDRKRQQRADFGHDVHTRAASPNGR